MTTPPPFNKVLIANRGEIACRVMRTLDQLGIASVAVYHGIEASALHVDMASEAVEIMGDTPVAAYLDAAQIIRAALTCGAQAIHPGYGFLSENAEFSRAVAEAGLTFIGPDPDVIELMGDKIRSRDFARANGVPVAPSVQPTGDLDTFLADAAKIGFPLLIKASAGGGGKGMSIVRDASGLVAAARTAASEAERYFNDPRIYAELYIERPRHIEVQVMGDSTGNVVHFFERECSIQRRFQKIVEEAPSATLTADQRNEICAAALRLAKAANYRNAGTVEFIMAPDGQFYFLEMNTRLQVEHPVTEMITGHDLVALQIDVAAGRALPMTQDDIRVTGHSIECRISAEDPSRDFLPETGRVLMLKAPETAGIRFENGLKEGRDITASFDPMLAKLVVHAPDRAGAIDQMHQALRQTVLLGVGTNINYLAAIINHAAFRDADLHTDFIRDHADALTPPALDDAARTAALLAAATALREVRDLIDNVPEPYASIGGWRN